MPRLLAALAVLALAAGAPSDGPTPSPWRPFDLGSHGRPVSTQSAEAQTAFDQGLVWAFAFNYDEAERAFREAARRDPSLAMAWWGIALANGPHINNMDVDEMHAKAAWEALGEARRLTDGASAVEKALVEALGARYAFPQPADRRPLDEAYAKAMADVHARFPKDADVATLYAEALMDVRPWDQWGPDGTPQPGTREVLAALDAARRLAPRHPGALHLTIHALESSPHPERATTAADELARLVPDSSHLVHMPSHVYIRTGRWADGASANERAIDADTRYSARTPELGFYRMYQAHNLHFLVFTAMMEGRREKAVATAHVLERSLPPERIQGLETYLEAFLTTRGEVRKRFGLWEDILKEPVPPKGLPLVAAWDHSLRSVAHAALGHVDDAEQERMRFVEAAARVPKEYRWGSNAAGDVLGVVGPYLEGEIAFRRGERERAVSRLRDAVAKEDALLYDEPPACTVPARHALGAVLLADGRAKDAEAVYRADLKRFPENGWSLQGLARALRQQKKADASIEARARAAWKRADVEGGTSCLCVPAS
jgi:tetratricopeptide (TPR) repeat protein